MNKPDRYELKGKKLEVLHFPHPTLKKKSLPIDVFDDSLEKFVLNSLYTMYQSLGIGLAAPQVGRNIRLFVADVNYTHEGVSDEIVYKDFNSRVFINPCIVKKEGETLYREGCLSFPGLYENVKRFEKITVEYVDMKGEKKTCQAEGLLSICIQHEIDHLDGIVFVDRMSRLKRHFLMKKYFKKNG